MNIKKLMIIIVCFTFFSVGINDIFASDKKDDEKQQISLKQKQNQNKGQESNSNKKGDKVEIKKIEDYIDGIGDFSLLEPAK